MLHRTAMPLLMAVLLPASLAVAQGTAPPPAPPPVPVAPGPTTQVPSPPGAAPSAQPMPMPMPQAAPYPGQPMPYASPSPYGAPTPYPMQPMPYASPMPYGMPAPLSSPYGAPQVPPPSGVQLSTELAGTWRGEANNNGQVTPVVHILRPDGQFQTFHQVPTGQGSTQVVQVWGTYSVSAMSPNQAVVHSLPIGWAPHMVCAQGSSYCMPVSFQQTSVMVEVVDANTVRTEQGTLTRQQP